MGDLKPALTASDWLDAADCSIVPVEVPEAGVVLHLRVLPADEGLALGKLMKDLPEGDPSAGVIALLRACLVTPDGQPLIKTDDEAQRMWKRNTKTLLSLQKMALELQGWDKPDAVKNG